MATLTRKKLLKLMGKELEYTGTLYRFDGSGAVLINVKYKGKLVTDHVWVSATTKLQSFKEHDRLVFTATAITYTDSKGVRKHGLEKCFSYMLDTTGLHTILHDKKYSILRHKKQWHR